MSANEHKITETIQEPKLKQATMKVPPQGRQPNVVYAQYRADRQDGHIADDGISIYTGLLPCNWGTPPHSHSEIGFRLAELGPLLIGEARMYKKQAGRYDGRPLLDQLIASVPNLPIHKNGDGYDYHFGDDHKYLFFSSTSREYFGGRNGTRFIMQADLLKNPQRWDLYGTRKSLPRLWGSFLLATQLAGLPYDWMGIWGGFSTVMLGSFLNDPDKWYCSEIVHFLDQYKRIRILPRHWTKKMIKTLGYTYLGNGAVLNRWTGSLLNKNEKGNH